MKTNDEARRDARREIYIYCKVIYCSTLVKKITQRFSIDEVCAVCGETGEEKGTEYGLKVKK